MWFVLWGWGQINYWTLFLQRNAVSLWLQLHSLAKMWAMAKLSSCLTWDVQCKSCSKKTREWCYCFRELCVLQLTHEAHIFILKMIHSNFSVALFVFLFLSACDNCNGDITISSGSCNHQWVTMWCGYVHVTIGEKVAVYFVSNSKFI